MVELVRQRFGLGDLARPMRHRVRAALRQTAPEQADRPWVDDALIVITELVHNVGQHTDGRGEIIVSCDSEGVLIEVGDTSTVRPAPRRADPSHPGGRGLLLIEALACRWGVRTCTSGKVIWARIATTTG